MDDERQLLEGARAGDPDAWELLYRRSYPRLIAFARRRLASPEQAEEAVSETMVRAMDQIAGYRPTSVGLEGWFFGIARNVVFETYRAGQRQRPADPATLTAVAADAHRPAGTVGAVAHGAGGAGGADDAHAGDPAAAVLRAEEHRLLADAFGRLSEADQRLLELRVVAGLDAEQVGRLTGRRAGAVRTAQSRALARLRVQFEGLTT